LRLRSSNGRSPTTDLRTALLQGLAPDGGLYLPEQLSPMEASSVQSLRGRSFAEVADQVAQHLLADEVDAAELSALVRSALDFPVPLVELERDLYALELFHGPTLAFKDVGARFMAALLGHVGNDDREELTILVATSGDTGSAVAQAFLDVPWVRTVVLYPRGKVSELQERQFTTLGGNVRAIEVEGTFDDCQRIVKEAFADDEMRGRLQLTSANSINIGRLLPQIFYYFYAWAQLPNGDAPVFSVPSGNFGNLTGGLIAKRLGLPVRGFVAATNVNDTVPEYLRTGAVRPRPSVPTISNAMDVGAPSNLARILALYRDDLDLLRADVIGSVHDDAETRRAISQTYEKSGRVLDPHSAVGYLGIPDGSVAFGEGPAVFLATAHPVKFREVVEVATGSTIPIPDRLAACLKAERQILSIGATLGELRDTLLAG
jgi:threonine synthase